MVFQPIKYITPGEAMAAGIVLPAAAAITVVLRFLARTRQQVGIEVDDWLIVLALLALIGMGVTLAYGVAKHVLAYNTPYVEYSTAEEALTGIVPEILLSGKLQYAFGPLMLVCYGFTKTSIIFFYRRIFIVQHKTSFDILTIALLFLTAIWAVGFFLSDIFECGLHFQAAWGSAEDIIACCHSGQAQEKALAISDLILDLIILTVPMPYVWHLHMSLARKLALSGVLLVGVVAIGASIGRLSIDLLLFSEGSNPNRDRDQTITAGMYWAMLEAGLSVIAASLPSLRFLFSAELLQTWLGSVKSIVSLHSLRSLMSGNESRKALVDDVEKQRPSDSTKGVAEPTTKSTVSAETKQLREANLYQQSFEHAERIM